MIQIYQYFKDDKEFYHLTYCPLITRDFPNGIALRGEYETKHEAREVALKIEEYINLTYKYKREQC